MLKADHVGLAMVSVNQVTSCAEKMNASRKMNGTENTTEVAGPHVLDHINNATGPALMVTFTGEQMNAEGEINTEVVGPHAFIYLSNAMGLVLMVTSPVEQMTVWVKIRK